MVQIKNMSYVLCALSFFIMNYADDTAKPKKAIVIGASSGMGREVAKLLSKDGYIVGLASRRLPLLQSLQEELSNQSYIKQLDVAAPDARERLQALIDEMGGIDLIVISISAYLQNRTTASANTSNSTDYYPQKGWVEKKRTLETDAVSFIAMADVAVECFKKQNSGHLVGISSTSGLRGGADSPEYAGAKACIMTYMEGVRNHMIQNNLNVQVTDIIPGFVAVEHSPIGQDPSAYCEITCEQAGQEIVAAIKAQKKTAVIPSSIWVLAFLRKYMPDFMYNRYFPWL